MWSSDSVTFLLPATVPIPPVPDRRIVRRLGMVPIFDTPFTGPTLPNGSPFGSLPNNPPEYIQNLGRLPGLKQEIRDELAEVAENEDVGSLLLPESPQGNGEGGEDQSPQKMRRQLPTTFSGVGSRSFPDH